MEVAVQDISDVQEKGKQEGSSLGWPVFCHLSCKEDQVFKEDKNPFTLSLPTLNFLDHGLGVVWCGLTIS
ncbi:hypothetical protein O3P69_009375 [Scylla paramamosain]|uniref:Uncharacterized protein n=1 Tax=Scylla paramamosain TaxID=85552 RepID=A0AAW0SVB8_SCYPA